jgi:prevent-host-death family protein
METSRRVASSHLYTMRELNQNTAKVLREINESGEPALITRQGRPIALITPLAEERVEAAVLGAVLESLPQLTGEEPLSEVREPEEVAKDAEIIYRGGYA